MRLTLTRVPIGLQALGLGMAATALLLMLAAPYCASGLHVQIAAIVVLIDAAAIWLRRSSSEVPLAMLGLVASWATLFFVGTCTPRPLGYEPLISQGVAQGILLASAMPSVVGALLQRFVR